MHLLEKGGQNYWLKYSSQKFRKKYEIKPKENGIKNNKEQIPMT